MDKFYLIGVMLLAATTAHSKIVFSCTTSQGKQLQVSEQAGKFRYSFGYPNRPELVFENHRAEAIARSPRWNGVGRAIWSNLVLQNGQYFYTVYRSIDRMSPAHEEEAGVTISRATADGSYENDQYLGQVLCNTRQRIISNFPAELTP